MYQTHRLRWTEWELHDLRGQIIERRLGRWHKYEDGRRSFEVTAVISGDGPEEAE